jgi:site-specific DNA-methyltransferase (adenine-specific)
MDINSYLGKVYCGNAFDLVRKMPDGCVDACITDTMYGCRGPYSVYEWGADPAQGDPAEHWSYHRPIYNECLRVLRPGGILAWSAPVKFYQHFPAWFHGHRVWSLTRFGRTQTASGNLWVVQTQDQQPIPFPSNRDGLIFYKGLGRLRKWHPCPKTVEEMLFLVESLSAPGQIVLDPFCGTGSTLVAAQRLGRRWIGCDLSDRYCKIALRRLRLERDQRLDQPV